MKTRCIAKAYRGRPLNRIVVDATDRLFYITSPDVVGQSLGELPGPVGFPREAVFEPDDQLFEKLVVAFDSGDAVGLERLWGDAKPLSA